MAGYLADSMTEVIDQHMKELRDSQTGLPARFKKFKGIHDDLAKIMARLSEAITDNRMNFSGDTKSAGSRLKSVSARRSTRAKS